ncbi:MAG: preprotein translocase subunit SecY [Candidatus Methanofastidiosia archaeon]|jgi:preprotein translocase subunit SecY
MNNTTPDSPKPQEEKSLIFTVLDPIIHKLPEITRPAKPVPLKKRVSWSAAVLIIYFIMGEITVYGMSGTTQDYLSFFQTVLASEFGTLITLGIGPIIAASIFMQLFQGAEIFNFDLTSHTGKARFQGVQKILAIFLCFFEAGVYVFAGAFGSYGTGVGLFLAAQIGMGALLVLLMDEIVTKWGFGSGVSLFIAGGVAKDIFWRMFSIQGSPAHTGQITGAIPGFIQSLWGGTPVIFRPDLPDMIQVGFTVAIFVVVVYFETLRVEVPLSLGRFRGKRGGYPVRFIYTSVIPVIFTMSIFGTYQLFARTLSEKFGLTFLGVFNARGTAVGGIMYYLSPPRGITQLMNEPVRALIYLIIVMVFCAIFATLWAEITGMDSKSVAQKIQQSGLQVAGFKRDIRVIETVLDKYIPQLIVLGGITVGLLAAVADFTNALGRGTGILLAVSITYRMYIDLVRDPDLPSQIREMLVW